MNGNLSGMDLRYYYSPVDTRLYVRRWLEPLPSTVTDARYPAVYANLYVFSQSLFFWQMMVTNGVRGVE